MGIVSEKSDLRRSERSELLAERGKNRREADLSVAELHERRLVQMRRGVRNAVLTRWQKILAVEVNRRQQKKKDDELKFHNKKGYTNG